MLMANDLLEECRIADEMIQGLGDEFVKTLPDKFDNIKCMQDWRSLNKGLFTNQYLCKYNLDRTIYIDSGISKEGKLMIKAKIYNHLGKRLSLTLNALDYYKLNDYLNLKKMYAPFRGQRQGNNTLDQYLQIIGGYIKTNTLKFYPTHPIPKAKMDTQTRKYFFNWFIKQYVMELEKVGKQIEIVSYEEAIERIIKRHKKIECFKDFVSAFLIENTPLVTELPPKPVEPKTHDKEGRKMPRPAPPRTAPMRKTSE